MSYAMKISYPKKIYCTTFDEAMAAIPESERFKVMEYICGSQEIPVEYIRAIIRSADFQVKTIDIAISRLGFCLFGEDGKEKRRLKREKAKWLEYISVLNEVVFCCSYNSFNKKMAMLKKYTDVINAKKE